MMERFQRIVIISLIFISCFSVCSFFVVKYVFSFDAGPSNDDRVLMDSVKLNNHETLYWYKYELIGHTNVSYMSIVPNVCQVSREKNALIEGDLIYRIDTIRNDSIFIISRSGFKILHPNPAYQFIDQRFSFEEQYREKGFKKEVLISNICNADN